MTKLCDKCKTKSPAYKINDSLQVCHDCFNAHCENEQKRKIAKKKVKEVKKNEQA